MKIKNTWFCDTCGGVIKKPAQGNVEWLSALGENGRHAYGMRLVHHCTASPRGPLRCDYHHFAGVRKDRLLLHDFSLELLIGPDGLTLLLSMLAENQLPKDEVLAMIRRLHIPGYEQARAHFDRARAAGVFEPNLPDGFHWQGDIEAVLEFARAAK